MKKLLLSAGLALGLGLSANAAVPAGFIEVENWSEGFATQPGSNSFTPPEGWSYVSDTKSISFTGSVKYGTGYSLGTSTTQISDSSPLYNLFVTPQIKGTLTFSVRRYNSGAAWVFALEFYKLTKNEDGTFTFNKDTDKLDYTHPFGDTQSGTNWIDGQSVDVGDEYTYVGVRLSEGYIDEFAAPYALMPVKKDITFGSITYLNEDKTKPSSNANNEIYVKVSVPVTNSGNVDLSSSNTENFTVSLVEVTSTNNPYAFNVMQTVALPDLAIGETKTVELEATYPIPTYLTPNSSGEVRFRTDIVENFSGNNKYATGSWLDIKPYVSIAELSYDKVTSTDGKTSDTKVEANKPINFGAFVGERSYDFRIRNRGAKELVIDETKIEKPEWVTLINLPTSVAPDSVKTFTVKVANTNGYKEGYVKLNTPGNPIVDQIYVMAESVGEDEFFANFEAENALNVWYTPDVKSNWKVNSWTERSANDNFYPIEYAFNDKRLENDMQTPMQYIYTPLLEFEEGETFSFWAAKKSNYSSSNDIKLNVAYSQNRNDVTELGTILVTNEENSDLEFSSGTSSSSTGGGQNVMKRFSFTMPAGQYYIRLGAGYVLVDNFHGGKVVEVDYDIVSVSAEVGKTKIVNNPLTFTSSFKNLNTVEVDADSQKVSLYANGVVVATAEAQDLNAGETVTYNFEYNPHAAGETVLYAEITIGEYSVKSNSITVNVLEESSMVENHVGTRGTQTQTNLPLKLGDKNSKSEIILTADDLGFGASKILKLSFPYYKSSATQTGTITVWMENIGETTELGTTFPNPENEDYNLTQVLKAENFEIVTGGSTSDPLEMTLTFDVPFEYTGGNLRLVMEKLGEDYAYTNFYYDSSMSSHSRYFSSDSPTTFENGKYGTGTASTQMPVFTVFTEKPLDPVTGTVKTATGMPIENAKVKATATEGDVYYEAVTNAQGEWSMTIFQSELEYTVVATADLYIPSTPVALSLTEANDIVLEPVTEGNFTVVVYDDENTLGVVEGIEVTLVDINDADAEHYYATTDEDGNAVFEDLTFGEYKIIVETGQGLLVERYEAEMAVGHFTPGDMAEIYLVEFVVAPANGAYQAFKNEEDNSKFDITVTWELGATPEGPASGARSLSSNLPSSTEDYTFTVALDGEEVASELTALTFTLEGVSEANHVVTITSVSPTGKVSEAHSVEIDGSTLGIMVIDGANGEVRFFDLNGIEIKNTKIQKGVYIRVEGNKASKVVVNN